MKVAEKEKLVPVMLRFEPPVAEHLREMAHAARLPMAVYVKQLVLGKVPERAPPLLTELSPKATRLLNVAQALVSNLSQLDIHARNAGEPLIRLTGETGLLKKLQSISRQIGLDIKSGVMTNEVEVTQLLSTLSQPAEAVNSELARLLNNGQIVPAHIWRDVLQPLQAALKQAQELTQ